MMAATFITAADQRRSFLVGRRRSPLFTVLGIVVVVLGALPFFLHQQLGNGKDYTNDVIVINQRKPPPSIQQQHNLNDEHDDEVHIVFSTDCSGYQHWQSIAFYYVAKEYGHHKGPITRIASGCTTEQQLSIEKEWKLINDSKQYTTISGTFYTIHGTHIQQYYNKSKEI